MAWKALMQNGIDRVAIQLNKKTTESGLRFLFHELCFI